jgi:hypothetical protein
MFHEGGNAFLDDDGSSDAFLSRNHRQVTDTSEIGF